MKRTTKLLSVIVSMVMIIQIFVINGIIVNAVTFGFTATQATNNGNFVHLSWSGDNGSKYMVEKKVHSDTNYQTISLKTNIKVLNIYPGAGDGLQSWMNTYGNNPNGTGNTMTVEKVALSTFNTQYATWLANNYDVLYFGAYDSNNNQDLSAYAEAAVETFIESGGGCVLGHDTASGSNTNFITLAQKYLNMKVNTGSPSITTYGSTQVVISKKGLLMNYPYSLGNVGDILTTPNSHSYYEFACGDVWFKYASDTWSGQGHSEVTTYNDGLTTYTGTNNFYLTTWNNVAMIQTGHSNGSATIDEQKITANLLYYLAQVSTSTSYDDHSAQDLEAPNAVSGSISNVSVDSNGKTLFAFPGATDNGSTYGYKLYTMNLDGSKPTTESGATSVTVKSGIKGYAVKVSQVSGTDDPGTTVNTTSLNFTTANKLTPGTYYAHIRAIDNADNVSAESIIQFKVPVAIYSATSSVILGRNISATSNVSGTIYIVPKTTSDYTTKAALDAVSKKSTSSCTANTACSINTTNLSVGEYQIYTVDASGNVSAATTLSINSLIVIIPKDTSSNVIANEDLKNSINIPELNDENVGNVTVKLVVDPVSTSAQQHANIAIAASDLKSSGKSIVASYDISMFKTVLDNSGSKLSSGKVSNSDITGPITLLIPVPQEYIDKTDANLNIIYIDDNGNVTPLTTTVVTIDGVKYLQFTTTHFSVYAIVTDVKGSIPKTGDSNQLSLGIQMFVIAVAGCGIVAIHIWKKRNTKSLT